MIQKKNNEFNNQAIKINGKKIAEKIRKKLIKVVFFIKSNYNIKPTLAVIFIGSNPASKIYVTSKIKFIKEIGLSSIEYKFNNNIAEQDILNLIKKLNEDININGILVQFPLPNHISQKKIIESIDPIKDIDGLHYNNIGRLVSGSEVFVPCTALGCLILIKEQLQNLTGLNAVIIGRSNLVGKPIAQLLLKENATVTIVHSYSKNIDIICSKADLVIAAVGCAKMVKGSWIKPGACVIDVGINRIKGKDEKIKIIGDVDSSEVSKIAGFLSLVPGGVGPVTIACLLYNTLQATCFQHNIKMFKL